MPKCKNKLRIGREHNQHLQKFSIAVWVEHKVKARGRTKLTLCGPVPICMEQASTLADLRRAAEARLGLPAPLQRWVVDRALCAHDTDTIIKIAGDNIDKPFYLSLDEPESRNKEPSVGRPTEPTQPALPARPEAPVNLEPQVIQLPPASPQQPSTSAPASLPSPSSAPPPAAPPPPTSVYAALVLAEQQALTPSPCAFECGVCVERVEGAAGVLLHECGHAFCRACLAAVAEHCAEAAAPCPEPGCAGALTAREERALLSAEQWERRLARSLAAAESSAPHSFHCRTRDCAGWALCEPPVARFHCPVCQRVNCLPCQAIHEGVSCEDYQLQSRLAQAAGTDTADEQRTRKMLVDLIARREAMLCPQCNVVITKISGCDGIICTACKTEICWVTRGRRWGPRGHGDISGGCRCRVGGKRCHPSCRNCH